MSIDRMMRDMVREEIEQAMRNMAAAITELQAQGAVVARLASALGTPIKRGPGRPRILTSPLVAPQGKPRGRPRTTGGRPCAVIACKRPARSKGYCAAHYQKYRMLSKTGRLPSDWVEGASPASVRNVVLPRGRAGANALADTRRK